MKIALSIIISISMLLSIVSCLDISAFAFSSGKCGDNVYYTYDESSNNLTISGNGAMYDYADSTDSPFYTVNNSCIFINKSKEILQTVQKKIQTDTSKVLNNKNKRL